ncbi:MAG: hypothetical protein H6555_08975 [Lewinellaceae bacterium]|nr:hypothetical protein [Lewinellaceae bacterium]
MADFQQIQFQLEQKRQELEGIQAGLYHARERLKLLESQRQQLARRFDKDNKEHLRQQRRLEGEIEKQRATAGRLKEQYEASSAGLQKAWGTFAPWTDPREQLPNLNARIPILLFPLRLETRFKTVTIGRQQVPQLWVRIFPDDCLVDSFEATPSETEIKSLQSYWASWWSAAGNSDRQRGAWRSLTASHGVGRATYLIGEYQPLPDSDPEPTPADGWQVVLTIPTEEGLGDEEKKSLRTYWEAIWRAGDDAAAHQLAYDQLVDAVGLERAGELQEKHTPQNIAELTPPGTDRATTNVGVVWVQFPNTAELLLKTSSWTQAARVNVLPERLVLIGDTGIEHLEVLGNPIASPLLVGPNPGDPVEQQFQLDEAGNLMVPEYLQWMTDFEEALRVGMAFRVNLSPAQAANGFDRLYVVGTRLSADANKGQELLSTLLQHHQHSSKGFSLLPQGTPTNNTDADDAGYSSRDDADRTFDLLKQAAEAGSQFDPWETNPYRKRDGAWLAQYLGIDPGILQLTLHADGRDQGEARAMNTALFPATLGYWLDTQMQPVFSDKTIQQIRQFFNNHVLGRGAIPAVRIGRQPYGILPTTNYNALGWLAMRDIPTETHAGAFANPELTFLRGLYGVLRQLDQQYWTPFAAKAPHIGQKTPNPQQLLLDLVGLHPSSVEFYQQWAQGVDHWWNRLQLLFFMPWLPQWQQLMVLLAGGPQLLQQLGYKGPTPELLEKIFVDKPNLLKGPVVDQDPPLSETEPLRSVTPGGQNYIAWLLEKGRTNMDDLRAQRGFTDNRPPTALLYLKLRHALELGYYDLGLQWQLHAKVLDQPKYQSLRREPAFVHVAQQPASESRYEMLYKPEPVITGNAETPLMTFLPQALQVIPFSHYLPTQLAALEELVLTPTARLERLFAEHIDCCTYRWDAWMQGLGHYRLQQLRAIPEGGDDLPQGIYLGAFAWVENLRPDDRVQSPVTLPDDLAAIFADADAPPLTRDTENGGFIHAPSLNHAVTAAVLRNGYMHEATPTDPGLLNVNLTSERVRIALQFIEGIRNGQRLGALLGYQFERGLHDRYAEAEVDEFIYDIRRVFPLRARRIKDTLPDEGEAVEKIEARNVVDGLRMVEHIKTSTQKAYPWGKNLKRGTAAQEAILNAEADRLLDIQDAIADLAMAESVHQAVQDNYDRAAASLDAYSRATFPPDPDVVKTPRSGVTLTHRVGVQLPIGAPAGTTPRSAGEPALNAWVASMLPPLSDFAVNLTYTDPVTQVEQSDVVTALDIGLEPLDILYSFDTDREQAMTEIDDRLYHFLLGKHNLRPDTEMAIHYTTAVPGKISFFELQPLLSSLRALVLRSRPLQPGDVAMPSEAKSAAENDIVVPENQVTAVRTQVAALHTATTTLATALQPGANLDPATATSVEIDAQLVQLDAWFDQAAALQLAAGLCGVNLAGLSASLGWRKAFFQQVIRKARALATRWQEKQASFTQLMSDASAPGLTLEEQWDKLQQAERAITTTYTLPLPATPADFILQLGATEANFVTALTQLEQIPATAARKAADLMNDWNAIIPLALQHDLEPFTTAEEYQQVLRGIQDLYQQVASMVAILTQRLAQADGHLAAASTALGEKKARALVSALQALLGDDFRVVWQFALRPEQGEEWQRAWDDRAQLTQWLEGEGRDFPVDDWLYGVARVRTKMHDWEQLMQLTGAFGRPEPQLTPLQFPYTAGEPWLALDFPETFDPQATGDRLLYTACYSTGTFQQTGVQAGLLLDEWTEVIPGPEETTGLAFHYDRPNNEPPQIWLLAVPAASGDNWQWDDLTAAVREAFVMARKRVVEPSQLEATPLARFLPATIAAVTFRGISISNNLAVNNQYAALINLANNG